MLSFANESLDDSGRLTRRTILRLGSLGLGSLTLANWLRGQAQAEPEKRLARDTAVIHVVMGGGPSHIDTFDPKPDAPAEIRGEFGTIATTIPGLRVTEHLPCLAQAMKHFAVVRSVRHTNPSHLPASHWMMTGYQPPDSTVKNINPYCGAVVGKVRGPNSAGLPAYVSIPRRQSLGGAGYLGTACNPFTTDKDPGDANFGVPILQLPEGMNADRLRNRQALLAELEQRSIQAAEASGLDAFERKAIKILNGPRTQQAFDLTRENPATRDRYGRTPAGQRCLLARRLVEAGVTFVTVLSGGEWDTHKDNFSILKKTSLPLVDRAFATLAADLQERGLNKRVLLLISAEFGRTPTINKDAGRDHWPGAFTVLFSGGGMRVGRTLGATDRHGRAPITTAYSPGDVLATVYGHMGIDTQQIFHDRTGRPLPILADGKPIAELY
ncbi:DUF1501 domain-containing protein [soil metagenome]